jgi:hypothetical protein
MGEVGELYKVDDALDFCHFFNEEALSDVTMINGGRKFHLHKLLLVNSSDVFKSMLSSVRPT